MTATGCSSDDGNDCGGACHLKQAIQIEPDPPLEVLAQSLLPVRGKTLQMTVFGRRSHGQEIEEVVALVGGRPSEAETPLVRVHSVCLTGDVFGSEKCDCGHQLQAALAQIIAEPTGILLYMLGHEGRGIGLAAKVQAYHLQDQGHDTISANLALGYPIDARDYTAAARILEAMGVGEVDLLTNNPDKIHPLDSHGVRVRHRVPLRGHLTAQNADYLRLKDERMGHLGASHALGG